MPTTLRINDETTSGHRTHSFALDCMGERVTVRELIRARIYQEVQEYNLHEPECFRGLVAPSEAERTDHGYRLRERRKIDWQQQYQKALDAFEKKGFFVLVGEVMAHGLDQEFDVQLNTEVSFVKLAPLVAG